MHYSEYYSTNDRKFNFFVRSWTPNIEPKGLILLLHGLSDHGYRFKFVAETLSNEGFVFIAPDLRGNGKSDGRRGHFDSLEQIMDDISFLLQETKKRHPGLPLILYSQSMGGNLAINYVLRFPKEINLAVVSSPWLRLSKQPPAFLLKLASLLGKMAPSLLIPNGIKSKDLCHDYQICHAYDTDPLIHWRISVSTFNIINSIGEWAMKYASGLKTPLLLLHSEADPITSYNASREFFTGSKTLISFISYKELFHELHNEPEKEHILTKIIEWLNSSLPKV